MLDLNTVWLESQNVSYELRILGINYFVFIVIVGIVMVLGGFTFYLYWKHRKRELNRKEVFEKVYAFFATPEGHVVRGMYNSNKGQMKAAINKKDVTVTEWLKLENKEGYEIDTYYLLADFRYYTWYPEGKPRNEQVQVPTYFFKINDPCPKMKHGIEELTKTQELELTSRMAQQIQEENELKIIVGSIDKYIRQINQLIDQYKWVKYMLIGVVVVVILGLVGVVLGVINMSTAKSLSSQINAINQYIMGH